MIPHDQILEVICRAPMIPVTEIAEQVGRSTTNVSRYLVELQHAGKISYVLHANGKKLWRPVADKPATPAWPPIRRTLHRVREIPSLFQVC